LIDVTIVNKTWIINRSSIVCIRNVHERLIECPSCSKICVEFPGSIWTWTSTETWTRWCC